MKFLDFLAVIISTSQLGFGGVKAQGLAALLLALGLLLFLLYQSGR